MWETQEKLDSVEPRHQEELEPLRERIQGLEEELKHQKEASGTLSLKDEREAAEAEVPRLEEEEEEERRRKRKHSEEG